MRSKSREGYRLRDNGDLERVEGSLVYVIVRQQSNPSPTTGVKINSMRKEYDYEWKGFE